MSCQGQARAPFLQVQLGSGVMAEGSVHLQLKSNRVHGVECSGWSPVLFSTLGLDPGGDQSVSLVSIPLAGL